MKQSEKTDALNKALLKVHADAGPIIEQDSENPGYRRDGVASKYASLGAVLRKIKPIANKHGILIQQYPGENHYLMTRITHGESGQFMEIEYPVRVKDPNDPQKLKSGHTYARRDSLELLFNVAEADGDDDGNSAADVQIPRKGAGRPPGTKNSDGSNKRKYESPKSWEPDPKAIEIKNRLHGASSNEELEVMIDDLKMIKEGAKVSEWDTLSGEAQKFLGEVWEEVNKTLKELPKTEDKISDEIPF